MNTRWAGLAALASIAMGCLDDPPTFAPRGQIPPFIVAGQVSPPLNLIYEGPAEFSVNVPFRSEDVNIDLRARLYRDLVPGVARATHEAEQDIAAGIYEDTSRSVTMDWRSNVRLEGCHSITMILTYETNFDPISLLPLDESRAARVVWWLNIEDEAADGARMSDCPRAPQADSE